MRFLWGLPAFFAVFALFAGEPCFRVEFFSESDGAPPVLSGSCPVLQPVVPAGRPWRFFASEPAERPLVRSRVVPTDAESGRYAVLRYPAGCVRLHYWDGDVYGEVGQLVFLLPESEKSEEPLPSSPYRLDGPFIRSAFGQLVNFFPEEPPVLPENFKSEYTARVTDSPLRRGCSMPEEFGADEARAAAAAGANLLRFRAGTRPERQLDAAREAGLKAVVDCAALSPASLAELARNVKEHPALAGLDLGGGPAGYERALAVRQAGGTVPLLVSADVFGSPEAFDGFSALPLPDIVYAVDIRGSGGRPPEERLAPLIGFQRRNGARIFVRTFESDVPGRFIDAAEKRGWDWCTPYPAELPYTNYFRRNRP